MEWTLSLVEYREWPMRNIRSEIAMAALCEQDLG